MEMFFGFILVVLGFVGLMYVHEARVEIKKCNDIIQDLMNDLATENNNRSIKLTEQNSYLKARLSDYEKTDEDTKFIRYAGETYRITEVSIEDPCGNQAELKKCTVESVRIPKRIEE